MKEVKGKKAEGNAMTRASKALKEVQHFRMGQALLVTLKTERRTWRGSDK